MRPSNSWLILATAFALFACGDDGEGALPTATATSTVTHTVPPTPTRTPSRTATTTFSPTVTVTATPVPQGAVALFSTDPQSTDNPFPTDRLLGEDGRVQVSGPFFDFGLPAEPRYDAARGYFDLIAEQVSTLTGFSTYAPIRVRFNAPVVAPDGETSESVLVVRYDDPSVSVPVLASAVTPELGGDNALEIQPLVPLAAKTRYAYVVTSALLDATGHAVQAAPELAAALRGEEPTLADWQAELAPLLDHLRDERGVDLEEIAAIDLFTTQATTDDLVSIQTMLHDGTLPPAEPVFEGSPVPGLVTGIFAEGTPEFGALVGSPTSDVLAAVAVGSFDSFDFRFGPQMRFDPARVNGEVTPTVNHLDFYLTIPKAPAPPAGYPITIFGHGLGGSGRDAISIAQELGDLPTMVIGISDIEHGRRGDVANFFNLADFLATREHFRQTVADYMQLEQMIRHAEAPPFDQVDKEKVRYFGVSLGGIMGTLFMGLEPDVRVGVLSVPGGGLPQIVQSQSIGDLLKPLISLISGVPLNDPFFPIFLHRSLQVAQWMIDPGDPINTAPFVLGAGSGLPGVPPKLILMHEGIVDTVVPNETTDALALAMGLPDANAAGGCSNAAGCSGIWRYVMTAYGYPEDSGHGVTLVVSEAKDQVAEFLRSDGTEILDASPAP